MAETDAVAALNHLVETCRDGEMGFWTAATHLQDSGLKWLFEGVARTRGQFADQLKTEIRRLGGAVQEGGSVAGSAHRGWMDIASAVRGASDATILREAVRGEDRAVHAYEAVLGRALPPAVEPVVRSQYLEVREMHGRLKALEEEWKQRPS